MGLNCSIKLYLNLLLILQGNFFRPPHLHETTFINKKMIRREKNFENDKRSKSVVAKQKLHDTLSVISINDSKVAQNMGMLNLVSDFHKSNNMRFKLLKDTIKYIDKKKQTDVQMKSVSPYKVHSDIMKFLSNSNAEGAVKRALSESKAPSTINHTSKKIYDIHELFEAVGSINQTAISPNKMRKLNILLEIDTTKGVRDRSKIESYSPQERPDADSPACESISNIKHSIYSDSVYNQEGKRVQFLRLHPFNLWLC